MAAVPRNTRTHYRCRTCAGMGVVVANDTNPCGYGPDPQCDRDVPCPNQDCYGGWVRFVPTDALVALRRARALYLRGRRSSILQSNYRKARREAMRPATLPPDEAANPLFQQACADFDASIRMFGDLDRTFSAMFGRPLERAA